MVQQLLDDKRGHEYDEDWKPNKGNIDDLEDAVNRPDAEYPDGHPSAGDTLDDSALASAENSSSDSSPGGTDEEEESLYKGSNQSDNKKVELRFSRKHGIVGIIVGLIIGGAFGGLTVVSGPLKLLHFSQLLQRFHFSNDESFSDSRLGKLYKYMKTRDNPERRNLGRFGNLMADHYEKRLRLAGIEPKYGQSGAEKGRIMSYEIDRNSEGGSRALAAMKEAGVDVPEGPTLPGEKVTVNLEGTSSKVRRAAIRATTAEAGMSKISTYVSSRLSIKRGNVGMFHPIQAINRKVEGTINDYINKILEEHSKTRDNGPDNESISVKGDAEDPDGPDGEETPDTDAEGAQAAGEADDAVRSAQQAGEQAGEEGAKTAKEVENGLKSKLTKGGAGALAVVSLVCGLRALGNSIGDLKYTKMIVPLMRTGMEMVSIGSQIQSGQDISMDELNALSKQLDAIDTDDAGEIASGMKSSAFSAASIQAEQGKEITGPDMPDVDKPDVEKPKFFQIIDNIVDAFHGGGACDFVTSTVGSWVVNIAGTALTASTPVGFLVGMLSGQITGYISGKVMAPFMRSLVGWLSGDVIDTYSARGALFGNYANYGTRLASNDLNIAAGGTELSSTQSAALKADTMEGIRQEFAAKSVFERYLSLKEPDSLASKIAFESGDTSSRINTLASLLNPIKSVGILAAGFSSKTSAAAANYDYGFPEYGFTLDEMDSDRYDNPFENAERVEPKLASLNTKYGEKCFGTTIDPDTGAIKVDDEAKRYNEVDSSCKDRSNQELTDYRFYLADMKVARSTECYEGVDDEACGELGFSSQASGSGQSGGGTTPSATVTDKHQDTSGMACAPNGLTGERVEPIGDGSVKIKLCDYAGVKGINASWSTAVTGMIAGAAADGITFSSGGFRTAAEQIRLRTVNGCPDVYTAPASSCRVPTARPGTSNHELGLAMDMDDMCFPNSTCAGNPRYDWLMTHASQWGIKKLSSEAWHWSVDGG